MNLLINIFMAWVTVVLMVLLVVVYALRKWIQNSALPQTSPIRIWNKKLRKPHKWLGLSAVAAGLIHGLYSSFAVLSPNIGTLLWVLFVLLGLSWMLRKRLSKWQPWIQLHRYLALASLVILVLHIVEVGGFVGIEPIVTAVKDDLRQAGVLESDLVLQDEGPVVEETENLHEEGEGLGQGRGRGRHDAEAPPLQEEQSVALQTDTIDLSQVPDGTYQGEAVGFRPGLVVEVIVKSGVITSVEVISHNEVKEQYWGRPVREIPKAIIESQSTEVDVISRATFTSRGIMEAVRDALQKAIENKTVQSEEEESPDTSGRIEDQVGLVPPSEEVQSPDMTEAIEIHTETKDQSSVKSSDSVVVDESDQGQEVAAAPQTGDVEGLANDGTGNPPSEDDKPVFADEGDQPPVEPEAPGLTDGVFTGVGRGHDGDFVIEVTIANQKISVIHIVSHEEREVMYYGRAIRFLPERLLGGQTAQVDVVAGATFSSMGIIRAVEDALAQSAEGD